MNIGGFRKHLIYFHILLSIHTTAFTFGATHKCQHADKPCIKLCCATWQFYSKKSYQCEILPKHLNASWDMKVITSNVEYRNINVLKDFQYEVLPPCGRPLRIPLEGYEIVHLNEVLDEDYCLTPFQRNDSLQYVLLPIDLICDKKHMLDDKAISAIRIAMAGYLAEVFLMLLLLLPTVFIYTTIKELRENIRLKLFMCYVSSMLMLDLLFLPTVYHYFYPFLNTLQAGILKILTFYFVISIMLWLNVICYEIWHSFQGPTIEFDVKKDRMRFIWYSLYVWGMAAVVSLMKWLTFGFFAILLFFNLLTFVTLSVKICASRIRVAKMTGGKHILFKTITIILRLFAMMGISRIVYFSIFLVWRLYGISFAITIIVMNIASVLDALLIFSLFVMKQNVRNILKSRFDCCRQQTVNTVSQESI